MRPKNSSIHMNTLKHKRISIQSMQIPQRLFSFVHKSQIPTFLSQKLNFVNCTDQNFMKIALSPYGYLVSFQIMFLKLFFIQKPIFEKCLTRLFEILDDDNFVIQMIKNQNSQLYLDWSVSKMKRMTSEYFKLMMIGQYESVDQIMQKNSEFGKILFFVFWSLLHHSKRVDNFEEFIEFDTIKEVLFDHFEIQANQEQNEIMIPDSSILIECLEDSDLYIINLPNFQSELVKGTSESIHINYEMGGSDMASDLRLTLESKFFIQDSQINLIKTRNFADLTNRTHDTNQNMQKTLRFKQFELKNQDQRHFLMVREDNFANQYEESDGCNNKNLFSTHVNDYRSMGKKLQAKLKIDRPFSLASYRTGTQKSLYDVNPIQDSDQYSVLDISIPTSKKVYQKQINKENQIQVMAESLKLQDKSLIGKWQLFHKIKKSQQEIHSVISKIGKKVENKTYFQQSNERPDFRKVKSRKRKSQKFDQENYSSEKKSLKAPYERKKEIEESQDQPDQRQSIERALHKPQQKNVKEYILHNPKGNTMADNIYSKYGYVNMNISDEFTNSLILKELQAKNESKIRTIKDKAREQRKIIKLMVQRKDKPAIINL